MLPIKPMDAVQAASKVITKAITLEFPRTTNSQLKEIARLCLKWNANERPEFDIICDLLKNVK